MASIKITLSELRNIVKQIIKEENPPINDVYLLDNQGKIDSKKKVGTHQNGKGFIPNELGVKLGFSKNPTRIPDKTRMMNSEMDNRFGTAPTMAYKNLSSPLPSRGIEELRNIVKQIIKE
jgi:hypothetical protein